MRNLSSLFRIFAVPVISVFLFACGGGGGGSNGGGSVATLSPAGTGTVTLLVTDAPNDDFNAINLTVIKAELLSDSGSVTLFSGEKTFDLLQLANVTEIFSVTHIAPGTFNKIRLTLTKVELVKKDGTRVFPKLPGNGKLDLNPRGSFVVTAGATVLIQLDMDAEMSVKPVSTGQGEEYEFRPVVFVKIVTDKFGTKLVRLRGTVNNLDALAGTFEICRIEVQGLFLDDDDKDGKPYCVMVDTAQAPASFFDINGDPTNIDNLEKGDIVTAVGRFAFDGVTIASSKSKEDGDDGSKDSNSHDDNSSDGSSNDDDSSDDNNDRRKMVLIAEVVWQGDFVAVNGTARSEVTTDTDKGTWFKFEVLPGQGYVFGAPIPVILQDGTKLFSRAGLPLDSTAIQDGVRAKVDGVFQDKLNDLKAALITLDVKATQLQLIGTIGTVADDFSSMTLLTDIGDRCVLIDTRTSGTQIFETSLGDDDTIQFDQMAASDLKSGQMANVFGDSDITGCLKAETIIYEVEGATIPVQPLP
ncbi:MAG: hypothetical protein BMS9Abin09_0058 [Gammaproteobacteria bacterium]|nr:MAG: hypothetical protein BMS9Abin09_0058 [Gammaproteobacteria bacterium]